MSSNSQRRRSGVKGDAAKGKSHSERPKTPTSGGGGNRRKSEPPKGLPLQNKSNGHGDDLKNVQMDFPAISPGNGGKSKWDNLSRGTISSSLKKSGSGAMDTGNPEMKRSVSVTFDLKSDKGSKQKLSQTSVEPNQMKRSTSGELHQRQLMQRSISKEDFRATQEEVEKRMHRTVSFNDNLAGLNSNGKVPEVENSVKLRHPKVENMSFMQDSPEGGEVVVKRRGGKRRSDPPNKRWSLNLPLESGSGVGSGRDLKSPSILGSRTSKRRVPSGDYTSYAPILNAATSSLDLDKIIQMYKVDENFAIPEVCFWGQLETIIFDLRTVLIAVKNDVEELFLCSSSSLYSTFSLYLVHVNFSFHFPAIFEFDPKLILKKNGLE